MRLLASKEEWVQSVCSKDAPLHKSRATVGEAQQSVHEGKLNTEWKGACIGKSMRRTPLNGRAVVHEGERRAHEADLTRKAAVRLGARELGDPHLQAIARVDLVDIPATNTCLLHKQHDIAEGNLSRMTESQMHGKECLRGKAWGCR